MRKFLSFIAIPLALCACHSEKWTLAWEEDFNGHTLDTTVWSRTERGTADWNNTQSKLPGLLEVRDGILVLKGISNPQRLSPADLPGGKVTLHADTAEYLTAGVVTKGKHLFSPEGRIEVRARLFGARGAWPAIWLLPDSRPAGWPQGGEIDIMERLNHDTIAYQTIHTEYTLKVNDRVPPHGGIHGINPDGYNVYAVEFCPDSLVFSVNGSRTFAYPRVDSIKHPEQYPFLHPWYMLIDMQLGGSWVGKVDPRELPVEMHVDWVRHYVRKRR